MSKKPAWEVIMSTYHPGINRPRRTSIHTIATIMGLQSKKELLALAKEMQESGKVLGYRCPDVHCLIFYLKELRSIPGMIDTANANVWNTVESFLEEAPFPKVKGFQGFPKDGVYQKTDSPWGVEDIEFAKAIKKNLEKNGYEFHVDLKSITSKNNRYYNYKD